MDSLPHHIPVAVIGGGPAGAMLAAELVRGGCACTVFDEKMAWEKPCGGGLTDKALRAYPFLRGAGVEHNLVTACELVSPRGRRVTFALDQPLAIFSRADLNQLLLDRARAAGASLVRDRVVAVLPATTGWELQLRDGGRVAAQRVAIASGARNSCRQQFFPTLSAGDWMATAGFYLPLERLPWPKDVIHIRFLPELEGYVWSFPRTRFASFGICAKLTSMPAAALRRRLEAYLQELGIATDGAAFYAHLLPALQLATLRTLACAGPQWAAVGDAAGLVDPITGEGLYYALRSAELLAGAWLGARPDDYTRRLRHELLPELEAAAAISDRFYRGRFLGDSVLERMTLFTQRSRRFRTLMRDLFAGAQDYSGVRARLYRNLAPALLELAMPQTIP